MPLMPALRILAVLLLLLLVVPAWTAESPLPHLDLELRLDPARRTLEAEATLKFQAQGLDFPLAPGLRLTRLELDGRRQALPDAAAGSIRLSTPGAGPHTLRLAYQGTLAPLAELDHRQVLGAMPPMADARGSFLPAGSGWYPDPGSPFSYRLVLTLPPGQKGLVPGTLVRESEQQEKGKSPGYHAEFVFSRAAEGIDLMAGPYEVKERLVSRPGQTPLRLRTWFYPDMADLAAGYLEDSARYIARYSELIGPYPFDAFSVVASPLPTGFGMPGLTYLGRDVLRLPFIRATSLGHEVLHNWWGNGVIPDWTKGNWSEGLTSFLADYAYKEDQSEEAAREARLGWLRNLSAVPPAEDTPLAKFTARHHGISSIVGYDKAAMVFLMLRDEIGAEAFTRGLRLFWQRHRFQRAGWAHLEQAFAEAAGRDLGGFFRQWVERPGSPLLKLAEARWTPGQLDLRLEQEGLSSRSPGRAKNDLVPAGGSSDGVSEPGAQATYRLRVPLRLLVFPDQLETRWVEIKETSTRIRLHAPRLVQAVDLDPDYRLWRRVDAAHFPPILREVWVAPRAMLLLTDRADELGKSALTLAEKLLDARPAPLIATGPGLPGRDPVLIVAPTDQVAGLLARLGLPPPPPQVAGKGTAQVWTARDEAGRPYAVVAGRDPQALEALQRPLPHHGRQSWLVFEGSKAVDKGIWPVLPERVRVQTPEVLAPVQAAGGARR